MNSNECRKIAERLVAARKRTRMTQADAAKKLGLTTTTLGNYERSSREPPAIVVAQASDLYQVNPGWLLTGIGPVVPISNGLSSDERELLDLARQAPETIPLLKKALVGRRAFVESLSEIAGLDALRSCNR